MKIAFEVYDEYIAFKEIDINYDNSLKLKPYMCIDNFICLEDVIRDLEGKDLDIELSSSLMRLITNANSKIIGIKFSIQYGISDTESSFKKKIKKLETWFKTNGWNVEACG